MKTGIKILLILIIVINTLNSADWPVWRGPYRNSFASEEEWNPEAIKKLKINWKINVGNGYSAVAVKDGKVYTMGHSRKKNTIYCLDEKTGKKIWTKSYNNTKGQYKGTRATPVIHDGKVYTFSQDGDVYHIFPVPHQAVIFTVKVTNSGQVNRIVVAPDEALKVD